MSNGRPTKRKRVDKDVVPAEAAAEVPESEAYKDEGTAASSPTLGNGGDVSPDLEEEDAPPLSEAGFLAGLDLGTGSFDLSCSWDGDGTGGDAAADPSVFLRDEISDDSSGLAHFESEVGKPPSTDSDALSTGALTNHQLEVRSDYGGFDLKRAVTVRKGETLPRRD